MLASFTLKSSAVRKAAICFYRGVGAGTTEEIAHDAARKAATQDRDVTVEGREGKAYGHPTSAAHSGSATGAGTSSSLQCLPLDKIGMLLTMSCCLCNFELKKWSLLIVSQQRNRFVLWMSM